MKLRDYQSSAVEAVFEAWRKFSRVLVVLPTGCGKTVVFASVIRRLLNGEVAPGGIRGETDSPGRVLVVAHREELVNQAAEKIERICPSADVQIEMAGFKVTEYFGRKADVVVSTVQTQCAGTEGARRMQKFDPSEFAAVIVDEAHHATAASYRQCIGHYCANGRCRVLGVTATPDRADEAALGAMFDTVAYEYTISQAIDDGWLVPVRQQLVKVESLDFSGVSTSAGDLNSAELAEVMEDERNLHGIVAPTLEICRDRRAILFAASVRQAERICEIINRSGLTADWVCGATPKDVRRQKLDAFRTGRTRILCNVGILTEGFDDAGVEAVVMARPTKSRALYAQMVGRATRPAAEIAAKLGEVAEWGTVGADPRAARRDLIAKSSKPSCLVVDFVGNSGRHKLITTVDILGGKEPDDEDVRTHARRLVEQAHGDVDATEALAEAHRQIEARKAAEAKRREFVRASARYVAIDVDPLNVYDMPPVERNAADASRRLTYKQETLLRTWLKVDPEKLGYARSRQLLNEVFRRCNNGLASLPQSRLLKRLGVCVPLRRDEATRIISRRLAKR